MIAVWARGSSEHSSVYWNRLDAKRWSRPQLLEEDERGSATRPRVASDRGGNALVIWQQSNGSRVELWSRRFD